MTLKLSIYTVVFIALTYLPAISQSADPVSPSEKNPKAIGLIKEAIRMENSEQFEAAIEKYKEVLKIEPRDFAAMNTIAGLYGNLDRPDEEAVWAQKAIDTNPKFWKALINLGNGLGMQGKFDAAITAYKKAALLAPNDPLPVYSLGVVAENQQDLTKALDFYKRSVELDPKFENGLFGEAAMYASLKRFDEAKAVLKTLLQLNPKAEDARQMLTQIEREKP